MTLQFHPLPLCARTGAPRPVAAAAPPVVGACPGYNGDLLWLSGQVLYDTQAGFAISKDSRGSEQRIMGLGARWCPEAFWTFLERKPKLSKKKMALAKA